MYNIYYFTPARGDKNLGKSYNDHCESVPNDDDWICIRDGDTMFLTPNYSRHIEDIIHNNNDRFEVIGCITNRTGMIGQLHNRTLSEDTDIRNHMNLSFRLEELNWGVVTKYNNYLAGHFMLFKKKAWLEHRFEEGLLVTKKTRTKVMTGFVDYWFSDYFRKKGTVGLAKGLYIFHLYRLFHKDRKVKTHLKND
jgi:hypothetical protein